MSTFRLLTDIEITQLVANGCTAENWNNIEVTTDGFSTQFIHNVQFSGEIRLGHFNESFKLPGGFVRHSGLKHVALHNVSVGDDCCIINVQNYIANYNIDRGVLIENICMMLVDGESTFGNGVEVAVLNETGGREVLIHNNLTAHQAYMMALYRHRPMLIEKLRSMTNAYVDSVRSERGHIGEGTRIMNTGSIIGVNVGSYAHIIGANRLSNGSINSNADAPVKIGNGCICTDFIISSGSSLYDGSVIERVFVGQACKLGNGYTATDSLFFCNCQGENGEACAIFAGPFTVTHHKSSLLIAGMYSFMNAGSGSNQSNHMYKLGPIHQGIMERGSKTASDSYLLWPSRVGAFSMVMGRHVTHSDTTNLPFSYLIEKGNTTYLVPGVNLRSVGTIRDAQKWPKRDKRTDKMQLDCINYNLLSPFTIQKMMKGVETLNNLRYASGVLSDLYSFHSTKIKNSSLEKGIKLYHTGIQKFMGNSVISRLQDVNLTSIDDIRQRFCPDSEIGKGEWVDIAGLIAPKQEIERLMEMVENNQIVSIEEINAFFQRLHQNYYSYEWTWVYEQFEKVYGVKPENVTIDDVVKIINKWKDAVIGLDKMVYEDARKEFSLASMTGFGADGDKMQKEEDFEQVRGDFESNPFVNAVLRHIKVKSELGDNTIARIEACR